MGLAPGSRFVISEICTSHLARWWVEMLQIWTRSETLFPTYMEALVPLKECKYGEQSKVVGAYGQLVHLLSNRFSLTIRLRLLGRVGECNRSSPNQVQSAQIPIVHQFRLQLCGQNESVYRFTICNRIQTHLGESQLCCCKACSWYHPPTVYLLQVVPFRW